MKLRRIKYSFCNDTFSITKPYEIIRETEKCYFVKDGNGEYRFIKAEIGKPIMKNFTDHPHIMLTMIDTDANTMKEVLAGWFTDRAENILKQVI